MTNTPSEQQSNQPGQHTPKPPHQTNNNAQCRRVPRDELKALFCAYHRVKYFESPGYTSILNLPEGDIVNTRDVAFDEDAYFEDREFLTYFYDFSGQDIAALAALDEERKIRTLGLRTAIAHSDDFSKGILLYETRIGATPVRTRLEELVRSGKTVTHIVRAEETYFGNTQWRVYRSHECAHIYEVENNGKDC